MRKILISSVAVASFIFLGCSGSKTEGKELDAKYETQATAVIDSMVNLEPGTTIKSLSFVKMAMPAALAEEMEKPLKDAYETLLLYALATGLSDDNKENPETMNKIQAIIQPARDKATEYSKTHKTDNVFALIELSENADTTKLMKRIYVLNESNLSEVEKKIKVSGNTKKNLMYLLQILYAPKDKITKSWAEMGPVSEIDNNPVYQFILND